MRVFTDGKVRLAAVKSTLARLGGYATVEQIAEKLGANVSDLLARLTHFCKKKAIEVYDGIYYPFLGQGEVKTVLSKLGGKADLLAISYRSGLPKEESHRVQQVLSRLSRSGEIEIIGNQFQLVTH